MKIFAPVKDFNGLRNNVRFVDGVGETDNPKMIEWFKSHGYGVSGYVEETVTTSTCDFDMSKVEEIIDTSEPDFESMTPNELRDWMREHGYGSKIKNTRNKEKLLEILRG